MFKKTTRSADYLSIDALEITLTGAFQTDIFLNFSEIVTDEYQKKQNAIKDELNSICSKYEWTIPKSGEGQKYEVDELGTGKSLRPPYYIECVAKDCQKEKKCNDKKAIKCNDEFEFIVDESKIKFYEFGFATVSISGMISSKDSSKKNIKISSSNLLHIVNDLDKKIVNRDVQKINALISNVTKKFDKTINKNKIEKFFTNEKSSNEEINISISNIRSLHRIFQCRVSKSFEIEVAKGALNKIAKLSNGRWRRENHISHFVGIANSAIVYNHNVSSNRKSIDSKILNRYIKAYKTVLETANAYYFIAEGITKHLAEYSRNEFGQVNKKNKGENFVKNIIEKVFPAKDKFEEFDQYILLMSNFFSVLDEFKVNLNCQGKSVWDRMEEKWTIKETVNILENQQKYSSLIFDKILKYNAQKFQWRLNIIVTIFTAIGAISLVEISQSTGFHWDFHNFIWEAEGKGEKISMVINAFGSFLAVLFVLVLLLSPFIYMWKKRKNRTL